MNRVEIFVAEVPAATTEPPARLLQGLSADDLARMRRYRHARDRWLFAAARALLRHVLATRHGLPAPVFRRGAHGKPGLVGAGPDFNLSHTDGLVVCAFANDGVVGVDCERIDRRTDPLALTDHFFAPREQALLKVAADPALAFTRLWTLKEAASKAVGLGLSLPLDDYALALDPPRLTKLPDALGPAAHWRFTEQAHGAAHCIAAAVRSSSRSEFVFEAISLDDLNPPRWPATV